MLSPMYDTIKMFCIGDVKYSIRIRSAHMRGTIREEKERMQKLMEQHPDMENMVNDFLSNAGPLKTMMQFEMVTTLNLYELIKRDLADKAPLRYSLSDLDANPEDINMAIDELNKKTELNLSYEIDDSSNEVNIVVNE